MSGECDGNGGIISQEDILRMAMMGDIRRIKRDPALGVLEPEVNNVNNTQLPAIIQQGEEEEEEECGNLRRRKRAFEDYQELWSEISQLQDEGKSLNDIASLLNLRGTLTQRGKYWTENSIICFLSRMSKKRKFLESKGYSSLPKAEDEDRPRRVSKRRWRYYKQSKTVWKRIEALEADGYHHQQIIEQLNNDGLNTPQGNAWTLRKIYFFIRRMKDIENLF